MQQLTSGALWNLPPLQRPLAEAGPFTDPRYVQIVRADKAAQAMSWVIAARTDYWQKILRARSAWSSAILEMNARDDIRRIRTDDLDSRWPIEVVERELGDAGLPTKLFKEIDGFRSLIAAHEAAWSAIFEGERTQARRWLRRACGGACRRDRTCTGVLGRASAGPARMTKVALSPTGGLRYEIIARAYSRSRLR